MITIPSATLGVVHRLGQIMTPDFRNGVELFVRGDLVVFRQWRNGEKFNDIEFGGRHAETIAEYFKRGADMLARQGGSGLPPSTVASPTTFPNGDEP